jgi:hypothetical protein
MTEIIPRFSHFLSADVSGNHKFFTRAG